MGARQADALAAMDAATAGQWRLFSKMGDGLACGPADPKCQGSDFTLLAGEMVTAGYGCIPPFDTGSGGGSGPTGGGGWEFTLAARGSVAGDSSLVQVEARLHAAVSAAIAALVTGQLG